MSEKAEDYQVAVESRESATPSADAVYLELRERISLLQYPPGAVLSENRLAEEFGVSRTPIRQALQRLGFDGLVSSRHGVGTMVTPLDFKYLTEVYALRIKLIDAMGELSSYAPCEGDVVILGAILADCRELAGGGMEDVERLGALYLHFNEEMSRMIGNQPLREITDRLFYQTSRVWLQLLPELDWATEATDVVAEIEGVIVALGKESMAAVAAVRKEHFILCLRRLNSYLGGSWTATA
jgi:DNA-binding GntR family transcriptional regulator